MSATLQLVRKYHLASVLLAAALVWLGYSALLPHSAPEVAHEPKLPPGYSGPATVARVIDGDTIELTSGDRVRYIGMDTPETVDPRKTVQCFGKEASAANRALVEGKVVTLVPDVEDRDMYDRFLRYVYLGDTFVNLEL